MRDLKIHKKLSSGFLVAVMLTILAGGTGIYGILSMGQAAKTMYSEKFLPLGDLTKATECLLHCRMQERNAILYTGDADKLTTIENDMNDCLAQFEAAMTRIEPTITSYEGYRLYTLVMDNFADFRPSLLQIVSMAKQGYPQEDLLYQMHLTTGTANTLASGLSDLSQEGMNALSSHHHETLALQRMTLIIIVAAVVVSALVSILFAVYMGLTVNRKDRQVFGGEHGHLQPSDV